MRFAGVVLAGGKSRRMGRTKATVEVGGQAIADRVLDALRGAGAEPLMIVGGDPEELAGLSAPVVDDLTPGEGPVGGVLSALEHLQTRGGVDGALILACDLVDVSSDVLTSLVRASSSDLHNLAWVATTDRVEPTCALWSLSARPIVAERFETGERALHRVLSEVPHRTVAVDLRALRNVNRPEDLLSDGPDR